MTDRKLDLYELGRLAELACPMPWEKSPAEVPYSAKAEFKDAITPETMLALLAVVRAAQGLDESVMSNALIKALAPFKG